MKTVFISRLSFVVVFFVLVSFSDPYSIKRISDIDFRYEFYTTNKKVNVSRDKVYYWFKGGAIHNSESGFSGELLDGDFVKMFHSNQLAEQGTFSNGLKVGLWKIWYPSGIIKSEQKWVNGLKRGRSTSYSENGNVIETGKYTNNRKFGNWINFVTKDTVYYMNDKVVIEKPKLSKEEKAQLKATKKLERENVKASRKAKKEAKEAKKKVPPNQKSTSKPNQPAKPKAKKGFFSRLFDKKQKNKVEND